MRRRIGFVGAGNIAKYHIEAARGAGFELFGICAKPNSERANLLAAEYGFLNSANDINQLKDLGLDAVAVVVETRAALEVYRQLLELQIPILIEKPVSVFAHEFEAELDLERESTLVGFNRRFYASVGILKGLIDIEGITQSHWNISELPSSVHASLEDRTRMLKENSIHAFDLMRFLLGEFEAMQVEQQFDGVGLQAASAVCRMKSGSIATISLSFGVPSNTAVDFYTKSHNLQLKPIEMFHDYSSIEIIEPGNGIPFKQYKPKETSPWTIPKDDLDFKPGFLEQYKEFHRMVQGESRRFGASLRDCQLALNLANSLENGGLVNF